MRLIDLYLTYRRAGDGTRDWSITIRQILSVNRSLSTTNWVVIAPIIRDPVGTEALHNPRDTESMGQMKCAGEYQDTVDIKRQGDH